MGRVVTCGSTLNSRGYAALVRLTFRDPRHSHRSVGSAGWSGNRCAHGILVGASESAAASPGFRPASSVRGRVVLSQDAPKPLDLLDVIADRARLSDRERSVLDYLRMGRSLDEIASILGLSRRTVKFHQANILQKLGVDSRFHLISLAGH